MQDIWRRIIWIVQLVVLGAAVSVFASSPIPDKLSAIELNWGRKETTDADLAQLKEYKNLRILKLWDSQITDKGLENLRSLSSLRELYLGNTQITDDGLIVLKDFRCLEKLSLANEKNLTDAGLMHIGKLTNLKELTLSGTDISNEGLVHLKSLTKLESLNLSFTPVTEMGLRYIAEQLPQLKQFYHADTGKPSPVHEKLRQIYECSGVGEYANVSVKVVKPVLTGKTPAEYAQRWFGKLGITTSLTVICHLLPEPGLYSHEIRYRHRRRGENPQDLYITIDTKRMEGKLSFKQWAGYFAFGSPGVAIKTLLKCKSTNILEPMYLPASH